MTTTQKKEQILSGTDEYTKTDKDEEFTLDIKLTEGDGILTYRSSNEEVATVSPEGLVTIKGIGKAVISVTASETEEYKTADMQVQITVSKSPDEGGSEGGNESGGETGGSKEEPKQKKEQVLSGTDQYTKTDKDAAFALDTKLTEGNGILTYRSSNEGVATVSGKGVVTIKGIGEVVITVTASETEEYKTAVRQVRVIVSKKENQTGGEEVPGSHYTDKVPTEGTVLKNNSGATFKVTQKGSCVEYMGTASASAVVSVPSKVTIDGITYQVTSIAAGTFKNNRNLTRITIGKNVTSVGSGAFNGCKKLKTVTFQSGTALASIGDKAFYGNKALTKITIPAGVNKIGKQAFYGCGKLKTITIKTKKLTSKNVGKKAFGKTPKNATIKVPSKKLKAYKRLLLSKGVHKKAKIKK